MTTGADRTSSGVEDSGAENVRYNFTEDGPEDEEVEEEEEEMVVLDPEHVSICLVPQNTFYINR